MSDGEIIIDVTLDKKNFDSQVNDLSNVTKGATVGLAAFTAAVVAAGSAVYLTATKAGEASERIKEMSARTGLSTDKFQELDYILSQVGGNADGLGIGIKSLTEKIYAAQAGNKEATEAFSSLGIKITDLKTSTREQIFDKVIAGLQKTTAEGKRAIIGADLLGRSFLDLAPLIGTSAAEVEKLRAEFNRMGPLTKEQIEQGDAFKDSYDRLKATFERLSIVIGLEFAPTLERIAKSIADFLSDKDNLESFLTTVKLTLIAISSAAVGIGAYIIALIALNAAQIAAAISAWAVNLAFLANPIALLIGAIAALVAALVFLIFNMDTVVKGIIALWEGMRVVAEFVFGGIIKFLTDSIPAAVVATGISFSKFKTDLAIVAEFTKTTVATMSATMKTWADSYKSSFKTVVDYFPIIVDKMKEVMLNAWTAFVTGVGNLIITAKSELTRFVKAAADAIKELPKKFYDAGVEMVMSLWRGLTAWIDQLIAWLQAKLAVILALLAAISGGGSGGGGGEKNTTSARPLSVPAPQMVGGGGGNTYNYTQVVNTNGPVSPAELRREAENSMALWGVT
ncbi:membrane hypothetical protein [Gammaproteobacteria bacterium]